MATFTTENESSFATEYSPFNDTDGPRIEQSVITFASGKQGIDTREIDGLRQGVSIKTHKHRFASTQPKIWAGNLNHFVLVRTIGQARSFTEYENSTAFEERPRFNPVQYIEDPEYPFPITFNNGPQQEEEAIIEPFTIKFRKNDNEGKFPAHMVRGSIEDGNNFENEDGSSNFVEQFIELTPPNEPRFFLDEGQAYFGSRQLADVLDLTHDPQVLYRLDDYSPTANPNFSDTTGNGEQLWKTGGISKEDGPWPTSDDNPSAAGFDGAVSAYLYRALSTATVNVGEMTFECFFYIPSGVTIWRYWISQGSSSGAANSALNSNYFLGIRPSLLSITYGHQHSTRTTVSTTFSFTGPQLNTDDWNHIAFVRTITTGVSDIEVYLNDESLGKNALTAPSDGGSTTFYVGTLNGSSLSDWDGRISNVKIIPSALTADEISAEYSKLGSTIFNTDNAVIMEGFTPVTQREISPFNDTRDEKIVDRIQTNDSDFISALKALSFDLDGDIRESYDKKSASAGGDVYGPEAARTGTDSIAFLGRTRGA
jgi:hypothetical protein